MPAVHRNEGDNDWASCGGKSTTAAAMLAAPATSTDTNARTHRYTIYNDGLCHPHTAASFTSAIPATITATHDYNSASNDASYNSHDNIPLPTLQPFYLHATTVTPMVTMTAAKPRRLSRKPQ